jgi:hypothetical protein
MGDRISPSSNPYENTSRMHTCHRDPQLAEFYSSKGKEKGASDKLRHIRLREV